MSAVLIYERCRVPLNRLSFLEPINEQLDDLASFCTNSEHFGIMSIDPTFDLGPFSVTTTTYEHLLLIGSLRNEDADGNDDATKQ